jgi:protein-disulfide isomerase
VQAPRTRPAKARPKRATPASPPSRRTLYVGAISVAAAIAAILIGVSIAGGRSGDNSRATAAHAVETAALLRGIPQHGTQLGSPSAPVKLVEYADLQCVYCGQWAREVFPTLVQRYVRTGKVQVEFRGLAFVGADSGIALRTALAAAQQDRLWHVVELLYRNQGAENTGWVNNTFLRDALASVPGLDASEVLSTRDGAEVGTLIAQSARQAEAAGVRGTPAFEVGRRGTALKRLEVAALDVPSFTAPLDELLAG